MDHSYFENRDCEFYPCHNTEHMNCLFCFCPLYSMEDCGGNPEYIKNKDGELIKDCSKCNFPHKEENYSKIIEKLNSKDK